MTAVHKHKPDTGGQARFYLPPGRLWPEKARRKNVLTHHQEGLIVHKNYFKAAVKIKNRWRHDKYLTC